MANFGTDKPSDEQQDFPLLERPANLWRPLLATPIYFIFMMVAVIIQSLWAPTWLVSSHTGLQIVAQSLPVALIALLALAFAALFVAVQQVTNVFSSRAPLILASDARVRRIVARTVIITTLSLLMGAMIPDSTKPLAAYMTAAGTSLLIASALLVYSYARFALLLIVDYSAPRSFVGHVVGPVFDMIRRNRITTGHVVYRVPLLGQTLRYALRRDDAETLYASLDGLRALQHLYVKASANSPDLRNHQISATSSRQNWLADELFRTYGSACEEALRLQSPEHEIDLIVDYFGDAACTFIVAHQEPESIQMMAGLARLATSPYQVMPGVTNYMTRPATKLAAAEGCAEEEGQELLASAALANWAVAIAYPQIHFGRTYHPLFDEGVRTFGLHPPWEAAIERVRDPEWNGQWANKIQHRVDSLVDVLQLARDLHEGSDGNNFKSRRRSTYIDWLEHTRHVAVGLVANAAEFARELERVNQNIAMFGSAEVQTAVRVYFDSYDSVLNRLSNSPAAMHGGDDLMRAASTAFKEGAVVRARGSVLRAMNRDLGEDVDG